MSSSVASSSKRQRLSYRYDFRSRPVEPSTAIVSPRDTKLSVASKRKTKTKSQVASGKIHKKNIDAAMDYLEEKNKNMEAGSELEQGVEELGFVVADNVSLEGFLRYIGREPNIAVQMRLIDGKVIAYELPLTPHSETVERILTRVAFPTLQLPLIDQLHTGSEADTIVGPNSIFKADGKVTPGQRPQPPAGQGCDSTGAPYPTMVVEVGYSESLKSLHELAVHYFSARTTIRLYLAIKIFGRRQNGTKALLALLYTRPNPLPTSVISFGTAPLANVTLGYLRRQGIPNNTITGFGRFGAPACNAPGIATYQISLPAAELFNGVPGGVPNGVPANIVIDLHEIQFFALK
jgi:hypothetical protein